MSVTKVPKSELEDFKQPATMDEILDIKMVPIIHSINEHVEKIYKDFNMSMHRMHLESIRVEKDLSQMVKVAWGLVNATLVRLSALEEVLIKNGLDKDELANALLEVDKKLKDSGEWKESTLMEAAKEVGINLENSLKKNP